MLWVERACRRKSGARLAELEELVEQLRVKLAKAEKEKVKLQVEMRDLSIAYETVSSTVHIHRPSQSTFSTWKDLLKI